MSQHKYQSGTYIIITIGGANFKFVGKFVGFYLKSWLLLSMNKLKINYDISYINSFIDKLFCNSNSIFLTYLSIIEGAKIILVPLTQALGKSWLPLAPPHVRPWYQSIIGLKRNRIIYTLEETTEQVCSKCWFDICARRM